LALALVTAGLFLFDVSLGFLINPAIGLAFGGLEILALGLFISKMARDYWE